MRPHSPPALAQFLLSLSAAPDCRDDLVGDMQERFGLVGGPASARQLWYWRELALALPHLMLMRLRRALDHFTTVDACISIAALMIVYFDETILVQKYAWPLTIQLLRYSPLTVMATCMASYILLHIAVACSFMGILRLLSRFDACGRFWSAWTPFMVTAATSLPAFYFMAIPGDHGGMVFRLAQLGCVFTFVGGTAFVLARRKRPLLPA